MIEHSIWGTAGNSIIVGYGTELHCVALDRLSHLGIVNKCGSC